jgi:hypothetical protein
VSKKRGNGEGSITKRRDGRYTVHTVKGPKRRHVYGKTRKEAADRLAKALSDRTEGIVYNNENMTVGEYLDVWLKSSVRGSIRQSTYDRDAYLVENHVKPALGRIKLKNLSSARARLLPGPTRRWAQRFDCPQGAHDPAQGSSTGRGVADGASERDRRGRAPATRPEGDAPPIPRGGAQAPRGGPRR